MRGAGGVILFGNPSSGKGSIASGYMRSVNPQVHPWKPKNNFKHPPQPLKTRNPKPQTLKQERGGKEVALSHQSSAGHVQGCIESVLERRQVRESLSLCLHSATSLPATSFHLKSTG